MHVIKYPNLKWIYQQGKVNTYLYIINKGV